MLWWHTWKNTVTLEEYCDNVIEFYDTSSSLLPPYLFGSGIPRSNHCLFHQEPVLPVGVNNWRCTWYRVGAHLEWDLYSQLIYRWSASYHHHLHFTPHQPAANIDQFVQSAWFISLWPSVAIALAPLRRSDGVRSMWSSLLPEFRSMWSSLLPEYHSMYALHAMDLTCSMSQSSSFSSLSLQSTD